MTICSADFIQQQTNIKQQNKMFSHSGNASLMTENDLQSYQARCTRYNIIW